MSPTNTARYKYNPNEMSEEEFLERFVVRQEVFDEIYEALQGTDYSVPKQHHIIVGQRGQGKTTILRKLKIEIQKDKKLSKFLLPVQFTEEQYSMRGLCSLWERVAEHLEDNYEGLFEGALEKVETHEGDDNYEMKCFSYLEKQLKQHDKKLVLLIDNINILLESLKEQEQHHLREILLTSSSFIIVGGSTKMFEQQYEYSKPFYEFFNIITLEGLTFDESIALLKILGDKEQTAKIETIMKNNPARIETLRRVTGGVPRTMVMLFEIFIEDNANTFDDLMKVLDDVTPLYQERMNHIPKVLQNITHAIAINWDGMLTKEIAKKTKLESKVVSAQLKQLEKYQIVDSVSLGKNKIYSIKERFFNIWYLMRFGKKKDRNRVEWLIQFLMAWYSRDKPKCGDMHTLALIELRVENFTTSYDKFVECMAYNKAKNSECDVSLYLVLLISKGQLYKAKEFLEMPEYQLKERYKPIWYALMTLMQDDFPHEVKKMGSELQGTVDEVLEEIERLRVKYALSA